MTDAPRVRPKRDWRRGWGGPFLAFAALLIFSLWWLGVFHSASVRTETSPALSYIYRPYTGSFHAMEKARQEDIKSLPPDMRGATVLTRIDAERRGADGSTQVVAQLGVLTTATQTTPPGWQRGSWPAQRVVAVSVRANPAVASWKAYGALERWGKASGIAIHYPTLELLGPGDRYRLWMPLGSDSTGPRAAQDSRP
ncbi:MAG: hypothetical protein ACP5GA_07370 [Acidithiobacillus sp.]